MMVMVMMMMMLPVVCSHPGSYNVGMDRVDRDSAGSQR